MSKEGEIKRREREAERKNKDFTVNRLCVAIERKEEELTEADKTEAAIIRKAIEAIKYWIGREATSECGICVKTTVVYTHGRISLDELKLGRYVDTGDIGLLAKMAAFNYGQKLSGFFLPGGLIPVKSEKIFSQGEAFWVFGEPVETPHLMGIVPNDGNYRVFDIRGWGRFDEVMSFYQLKKFLTDFDMSKKGITVYRFTS